MRDSLIAKRYARALKNLVADQPLGQVREQLFEVATLFDHESIGKVLRSPVMPNQLKVDVLKEACSQVKATESFTQFMSSIVSAGRVNTIPSIAESFSQIADEEQNIVRTKLCSAVALDEASVSSIKKTLESKLGKNIETIVEVDKSILGGLVIEIGNSKIDLSLKSKIEHLAQSALS